MHQGLLCNLADLGGRPLGHSVAVGMAYSRPTPCVTKQPKPGTINIWQQGPSYTIDTCLWQSHTPPIAYILGKGALGHTVRILSADSGESYQPMRPQSPLSKGKERKRPVETLKISVHFIHFAEKQKVTQ